MVSKVISSGKAVLIGSFISKGISIVSSIVLARLLFEEDYGALVLSAIFAGLITQIGGMGYELYYLQHKGSEDERRQVLQQVYNLRLVTNALMFIIQAIIGLILFVFTGHRMSGGILMLMSVSLLLEGFNAPQETLLKDQMEFKKITIGNIFKELFATIGKISAAFLGLGGYAFGIGPILGSFVRLVYLRKVQAYTHEYFNWDKTRIKEIFAFGKHVLFGSAAMYLVQQIDRIFLTMFFPQNIVGRYGFAWGNAAMPFNYLITPQSQLSLTYITRYKKGDKILLKKLLVLQRMLMLIFFPLTVFGLIFSKEIVILAFSEKWINTLPLIQILLIYYAFQSITYPFSGVLNGLGTPKINTNLLYVRISILIPSLFLIFYLFKGNIIAYLIAFCVVSIVFDVLKLFHSVKLIQMSKQDIIGKFVLEISLFLMILLIYFLMNFSQSISFKIVLFNFFVLILILLSYLIQRRRTLEAIYFSKSILFKK